MSSTESSGASAEATATSQPTGENAPAASFGSTRGSGLARGKRPSSSPAPTAAATVSGYTPTAIEILNAPREYQNPFAPVNPEPVAPEVTAPTASVATPAAVPAPSVARATPLAEAPAAPAPAPVSRERAPARVYVKPSPEMFPLDGAPASAQTEDEESANESFETSEKKEINILPPERAKNTPAQTWESEGFKSTREPRAERPRREERSESSAPADLSAIPEKFLYVRPGYNYVPTPSNYGGAPREGRPAAGQSSSHQASTPRPAAAPAAKASGGFFGWLKSLFSDSPAAPATPAGSPGEQRTGDRPYNRQRGGRGRSQGGGGQGGQGQSYDGGQRRSRGGRGRGQRGGDHGGNQGGSPSN